MDAVADWCEALHGAVSLDAAVSALIQGMGAEAGVLVRTNFNDGKITQIAKFDQKAMTSALPLDAVYGDEIFGRLLQKARPASVWLASQHSDQYSEFLASEYSGWQEGRDMKEFAVLVLGSGPNGRDHLELHFREQASPDVIASLTSVLQAMTRSWMARQVGFVSRKLTNRRVGQATPAAKTTFEPILGPSNPAGLSRAEFRVCLLLSSGLSVAGVSLELGLAETTVRSHLRSIYAKSETKNLAELIFCLIRSDTRQTFQPKRSA
ncbi:MAG: helix-turn-helix transcriptional regulator [Marinosulfonomonas sp.]